MVAVAALALAAGCAQMRQSAGFDKPGYATKVVDNRLWVFKAGSKEWDEFGRNGDLKTLVTRVGAGPNGMTIRAADAATIDGYLTAK
ncbi:MAG: hypothetical protein FJX68_00710 [Alphaproteobacteria bacterium]|nr:hypothetical protein [Alphaproteobacteria bacterium]